MKRLFLTGILLCVVFALPAQTQHPEIKKFIQTNGFENASIGICVLDPSGKVLHEYNKNAALTPASILKVVTTATALEVLGENYCFSTTLSADADTLIVHGTGDPTLGSRFFNSNFLDKWLPEIQKNIPNVSAITIDESYFGEEGMSERWIRQDIGIYYAPACYGISIFDNTYHLYLDTYQTDADGHPKIGGMQPKIPQMKFTNRLTVNQTNKDNGLIFCSPMSYNAVLSGDIPAEKEHFVLKGSIPDPGKVLGDLLADSLQNLGHPVSSVNILLANNRPLGQAFYTHYSPELTKIIRETNVKSNNHYAEHLIRAIGKTLPEKDKSLLDGVQLVKNYWQKRGLNTQGLFLFDGSGLSPSNALSPDFMCRLLYYMQTKSKYKEAFLASLPRAGKEGTVSNVLKNNKLEGVIYMKSGSIMGVQCFAGYYINDDKSYPFAVMVNRFTCPRSETVKAIEKLLLGVF